MKQRRLYTPPQATLLDCDGPELLANSNIFFANPDPQHPSGSFYEAGTGYEDNIAGFSDGDDIEFDIEE